MGLLWPFGNHLVRWESCMAHFDRHGMALPILPDALERVLRHGLKAEGADGFATSGWRAHNHWPDLVDDWVQRPEPVRACLGLHAGGKDPVVEVALVTPLMGVFMRHRWTHAQDAASTRLRIAEAHRSAAQLFWEADKLARAGQWPDGQRLLLIDDDLDLTRWGWLDPLPDGLDSAARDIRVMKVSRSMYLDVMGVMDGLHARTPETWVN